MSTEEPYELPEGWEWTTLGEIVEPSKEKVNPTAIEEVPYVGLEHIEKDTGQLLGCGSSSEIRSTKSKFSSGDLLYGKLRPYLNKVCMPGFDGVCSTDILVYPNTPYISNEYLLYRFLFDDFVRYASQNVSGVQHPRVNIQTLSRFEIAFPPLPEQRRIVAKIEELFTQLDAGTSALETAQAQLKCYRQSVLKAAVEGKLTEEWRVAHADAEPASVLLERIEREREKSGKGRRKKLPPLDVSELPKLPEGWEWAKVSQVGDVRLGRQRSPPNHTGDYMRPYLRVANVFEDRIDTSDILWMNFTPEEFETYQLRYGDVLLNEGQSLELVGRPAIYRDEVSGSCFQNTLVRFRSFSGLTSEYALCVFRAYFHNGRFQKIAKWTTTMAHLGAGRFSEVEFPLPPLAEQHEIVSEIERRLSVAAQTEATLEANLKRAARLRQSILKKAFRGELVPQDPNDEPASELIRRIKGERDKNKQKELPIKREKKGDVSMDKTRRSLYDVLVEAKIRLTPDELFSRSGFTIETIDEFYQELRSEVDIPNPRIDQIRPNNKDAYLKVSGNEDTQP